MARQCGFSTLNAGDGIEAVKILEEHPQEIIGVLLDLTMPRMDGFRTFDELQARNPRLPIIVTSGFSESDVRQQFQGKPIAGFLQKPYEFEVFAALLERLL